MAESAAVIFLDMDGVLSTPRAYVAQMDLPHPDRWIDPVAVRYLNVLCRAAGAAVVISSTWRLHETGDRFAANLARWGFAGALHSDWRTKRLEGLRGDEVREWLSRHPEVQRHVILDDDADFYADQPLVLTDPDGGMMREHLRAALAVLLPDEPAALVRAMKERLGRPPQVSA